MNIFYAIYKEFKNLKLPKFGDIVARYFFLIFIVIFVGIICGVIDKSFIYMIKNFLKYFK